ncbi:MAG: 4Fe-4S dicluster domain-containing protein [Thermoleophilia bacterium]
MRGPRGYPIVGELEPFDERDNVQARNTLVPGTPEHAAYYAAHPHWEAVDREIQGLPGLGRVGHPLDLPLLGMEVETLLRLSGEDVVDGPPAPETQAISPARATEKVKAYAGHLGADLVRVGPLDPAFVYTNIGKTWGDPARPWGRAIDLPHAHAVSIAVGLDPVMSKTGPVMPEVVEVMRAYVRLAVIATTLASYIRALGYPARAHVMPNYQVLCVPVAVDAGMGELGRHGLMITRELGSCLKLATVTTDLTLAHDCAAAGIHVDEFCRDCRICAESCPSGAVPGGGKKVVRGVEKWCINPEACFQVWNETGTDCGVCVASCPWTKPHTRFHRLASGVAARGLKAGWWMSRAERLAYGRFRPKPVPSWFEEPPSAWRKYGRLTGGRSEGKR